MDLGLLLAITNGTKVKIEEETILDGLYTSVFVFS
jgi:hypothetical protein